MSTQRKPLPRAVPNTGLRKLQMLNLEGLKLEGSRVA